jgi:protein TonB
MLTVALGVAACQKRGDEAAEGAPNGADATPPAAVPAPPADRPPADGPPRMTNADPPFRYPAALYAQKVQGNVTLRLWVDAAGAVLPESTRVTEPSGFPALDSSAVAGSEKLRFAPGMRDGRPTGAAILFPVYFRHPEAAPLPGDTVLRARP